MIYIGIDPGESGAFAYVCDGDCATYHWDCEMFINALKVLKERGCVACVEEVHAMPRQGVSSTFKFGKSAGYIEGVLEALRIPYQLIKPQQWKKEFSLIKKDKVASIQVCKRLFPDVSLRRTDKCRTDDDGMAEALLMAEYARRHF